MGIYKQVIIVKGAEHVKVNEPLDQLTLASYPTALICQQASVKWLKSCSMIKIVNYSFSDWNLQFLVSSSLCTPPALSTNFLLLLSYQLKNCVIKLEAYQCILVHFIHSGAVPVHCPSFPPCIASPYSHD